MSANARFRVPPAPLHFLELPIYRTFVIAVHQYKDDHIERYDKHGGRFQFAHQDKCHIHQHVRWELSQILADNFSSMPDVKCDRPNGITFTMEFVKYQTIVHFGKLDLSDMTGFCPKSLYQPFAPKPPMLWSDNEIPLEKPRPIFAGWYLNPDLTIQHFVFSDQLDLNHDTWRALDLSLNILTIPMNDGEQKERDYKISLKNPPVMGDDKEDAG